MPLPKQRARDRSRVDSAIVPSAARLDWSSGSEGSVPRELEGQLSRVAEPPIRAECVAIVLASADDTWTALVWSAETGTRMHRIPPPPETAWLTSVVRGAERHVHDSATPSDRQGGFPWLADAASWLALPLEDGAGNRLGAIAVASRSPRDWAVGAERRLLQILGAAAPHVERVVLQQELLRARNELSTAKLEAAQARERRDTMLAVLGHELRNPLAPLTNALELLWEQAPEALHSELSVMDRQLRQLRRLVDDLLDLSRLFRGDLKLEPRRVRLRDVLHSAAENVEPLIAARSHALVVNVSPELEIEADEARLTQVVMALLSNSAKHTPSGRTIQLNAASSEDGVQIVVEDDGGMTPNALANAFDAFNGARSEGPGAGGLGLGLPIARALIGRHGGEIELASTGPGLGTAAIVRLPRSCSSPSSPFKAEPVLATSLPLPRRVLIVDDNRDAADMLADAIRRWQGTAVVAYDPAAALELARSMRFDVALLDIAMPQMNGLELARELRKLPAARDLRIIAVSGFGEPSDAERSLDAGMDGHIVKPVSLVTLKRILTEARSE